MSKSLIEILGKHYVAIGFNIFWQWQKKVVNLSGLISWQENFLW